MDTRAKSLYQNSREQIGCPFNIRTLNCYRIPHLNQDGRSERAPQHCHQSRLETSPLSQASHGPSSTFMSELCLICFPFAESTRKQATGEYYRWKEWQSVWSEGVIQMSVPLLGWSGGGCG
ncbi:hypothetical protein AOLI_G00033680 [Acnodon oligacanthus]